jgi:hypothetical protein
MEGGRTKAREKKEKKLLSTPTPNTGFTHKKYALYTFWRGCYCGSLALKNCFQNISAGHF